MKKEISPKIRAIRRQYIFCIVTLFAAFIIGLVVDVVFVNMPLGFIIGHTGSLLEHLIHIAITMLIMFIFCYKYGYYDSKFVLKPFLWALVFTFVTQIVVVFVFGPTMWFSGPTISIAGDLFDAKYPELEGAAWTLTKETIYKYRWIFMIIAFWVLYAPSMILGKYLGSKKGRKDSLKAKEEKSKEKTLNEHPFD